MHQQKKAPKCKRGGGGAWRSFVHTFSGIEGCDLKGLSRCCKDISDDKLRTLKKKEHTRLLDVAVIYQRWVAHTGTQHAWNEHNEHRTCMTLFWQADRFHHSSRSRTSRWCATVPLPGNLIRGPRRPYEQIACYEKSVRRRREGAACHGEGAGRPRGAGARRHWWCRKARVGRGLTHFHLTQ